MGMFDDIRFAHRMPDGFECTGTYQSKDLECDMDVLEITPQGRLVRAQSFDSLYSPAKPLEDQNHSGPLNIYDVVYVDGVMQWHEYDLHFVNGALATILCHQTNMEVVFEPAP